MIKDLFEQLKNKIDKGSTDTEDQESPDSPVGQLTTDKIKAIVAELANAAPVFTEAGFVMEQLEIELGMIPKVTPQFIQTHPIGAEKETEILESMAGQRLMQFVLQSLFKSSRMNALMESTDLSLYGIEIDVTVPPSVRAIFKRNQSESASQPVTNDNTADLPGNVSTLKNSPENVVDINSVPPSEAE